MDYRTLGASGLNVPVIGLGTANFRGGTNPASGVGEKTAARLADIAIERGACFFDTGDIYGAAEEVLGKVLGKRRGQVMIATKAGLRNGPGPNDTGASRSHLIEACERSLRRLGTDYIDLFQIHSPDARTAVEETLSALDSLLRAGKIRAIGCSNHAGWQLMKSLAAADRHGWPRFTSHQISYSLACRDAEWELLPLGVDQNVAGLVWGPLAGGILAGGYGRTGLPPASFVRRDCLLDSLPEGQLLDILDCLGEVARETGAAPAQVALAWLMQRPAVATIIAGADSSEQLESNLDAIDLRLTAGQIVRLDDVSARPPAYPHWHQRTGGSERMPALSGGSGNVRVDKAFLPPRPGP